MNGEFRFKRVLDVRRIREQVGQQKLAAAAADVAREQGRLEEIESRYRAGQRRIERELAQPGPAWVLANAYQYAVVLEANKSTQSERVVVASEQLRIRQAELTELWRQREIMSRLERRHKVSRRRDFERREQAMLDDIAAQASPR